MSINKIIIENYKRFRKFKSNFNKDINIIVGDNESGKSTILEAIELALNSQIGGKYIQYELSSYLFNNQAVGEYLDKLVQNTPIDLPKILIEVYLEDNIEFVLLKGTNNSEKEDVPGVAIEIVFDDDYKEELQKYIQNPSDVKTLPIEYYTVKWYSFSGNAMKIGKVPLKLMLIDNMNQNSNIGMDKYISNIFENTLTKNENIGLSLSYRKLKELFSNEQDIIKINEKIKRNKEITDKDINISVDVSGKTKWETAMSLYVDQVPFKYIGMGEQNSIKMKMALNAEMHNSNLIMIEEPENNLSFSNMNKLIKNIEEKCKNKQLIINTHSTYVANKLGLDKILILNSDKILMMNEITDETQDYFKKIPGYNTLRMILSNRAILVEGASDELIVQKAYMKKYSRLPIEDGIDVISVEGLAFKRFLEIASKIEKNITVLTDNDGKIDSLKKKYEDYIDKYTFIKISYCLDETLVTLEDTLVECNDLNVLNGILGKKFVNKEELNNYMKNNKTECALKLFETEAELVFPKYIEDAI
ncbi:MAG: AAA family ATPase [Bacilli bacterium]